MKILHILMDIRSSWGGPVRSVRELVQLQRSFGFEVTVMSVKSVGAVEPFEDAKVMTFAPSFPSRFRNSSAAIRWLRENAGQYDLVLVSEIWSVMIQRAMRVLRRLGIPYVVQPRGSLDPYDLKKKGLLKRVLGPLIVRRNLEGARCLLTASQAEEERAQTFGAKTVRKTLPHPVKANPPGDGLRLRSERGIPPGAVLFLFLSRIDPKKRVDLLLEGYERAARRLPPSRLLIAGDGNPRLLDELKRRAQSLSCARDVEFLGFQSGQEKSDLLAAADVFVLPSDFENFGIAVVEALHAGLPVILSTGVQLWQGIVAAGAGLAFTGKVEDLSEIFIRLGGDAAARSTMKAAALSYAACFTPEVLSPEYFAFWSSFGKAPAAREGSPH
jgi:glycosyltransferase involved in cell wall biosynthesis